MPNLHFPDWLEETAAWFSDPFLVVANALVANNKKADVVQHPKAWNHIGLLVNEPPGSAELPFI